MNLRSLWARRPLRWILVPAVMLMLLGAGRLSQVAWDSVYLGARGPYLQQLTPASVIIRWQSEAMSESRVRYGLAPDQLLQTAGDGRGYDHEVTLRGLTPDTRYFYAVNDGAPIPFVTPPSAGNRAVPVRLWVIGDSGKAGPDQIAVRDAAVRWMAQHPRGDRPLFDAGLALGDNAYTSGTNAQYQAAYFAPYADLLRSFVIWPVYGNHDARRWSYFDIFTLPEQGESGGVASGSEHWYSFDHGPVHVVVLDSEASDRSVDGRMLRWLRADLAANQQPWVIAALHHPPYTKGSHNSDNPRDSGGRMKEMRENALPLLEAAGVDLVLSGHSHTYERSHLIDCHYGASDSLSPAMMLARGGHQAAFRKAPGAHQGTVYIVAGASAKVDSGRLDHPVMAQANAWLGSLVIDVAGARMEVRYIDTAGAEFDSFVIEKDAAALPRASVCGGAAVAP